jgi:hypothetical protein
MPAKARKLIIFGHEDMEARARYCSAPVADMDRRVAIDIFFVATDGRFAEISYLYGGQHDIVRSHYLWKYPVPVSGILSKEEVRSIRNFSSDISDLNRNAKRLRRHYPVQACTVDKNTPGWVPYTTELCSRWNPDLRPQPGFSVRSCLFQFKTTDRGDPFAKKPG